MLYYSLALVHKKAQTAPIFVTTFNLQLIRHGDRLQPSVALIWLGNVRNGNGRQRIDWRRSLEINSIMSGQTRPGLAPARSGPPKRNANKQLKQTPVLFYVFFYYYLLLLCYWGAIGPEASLLAVLGWSGLMVIAAHSKVQQEDTSRYKVLYLLNTIEYCSVLLNT